jgi:hypothetical protein
MIGCGRCRCDGSCELLDTEWWCGETAARHGRVGIGGPLP